MTGNKPSPQPVSTKVKVVVIKALQKSFKVSIYVKIATA